MLHHIHNYIYIILKINTSIVIYLQPRMMGYNEVAKQELNNLGDPFKGGRNKLRPLVPRPYLSPSNHDVHPSRPTNHLLPSSLSTTTTTTTLHHHHNQNFGGGEEVKAETAGTNQVMVSSRWNPTAEQLGALEELYRRGTRTPSADQIQHITSQLRRYGKIEGKNVFYWFQNHKARERQKRRRHVLHPTSPHSSGNGNGGNKIGIEMTEQKSCKWVPSSTNKECELGIEIAERGATKAETASTSSDYGCSTFHETSHQFRPHHPKTLHNNNNISPIKNLLLFGGESNATWHTENTTTTMVQTSSVFPFSLSSSKPKDLNHSPVKPVVHGDYHGGYGGGGGGETLQSPTLQLFPVALTREEGQNNNHTHNSSQDNDDDDDITGNEKVVNMENNPFPYYQFL